MFKRDRAIVYGSNESKNLFINDTERLSATDVNQE